MSEPNPDRSSADDRIDPTGAGEPVGHGSPGGHGEPVDREDPIDQDSSLLRPMHPALDTPPLRSEEGGRRTLDRVVFGVAAAVALAFVLWGAIGTESLGAASGAGLEWVVHNTGWLFALAASGFVIFTICIAASRYGRIPLGDDGEEPEFSTVSWIAMMFSAGMGIGLVFYGVTEPVSHLIEPPPGTGGGTDTQAVRTAMATTMFHWSLHPWAIYSVVGLALAYSVFRKRRSLLISSAFTALVGTRVVEGPVGRAIDIFAIFATLFGSATSLGIGALQIGSGLQIVAGLDQVTNGMLIGIIAVLTAAFVVSAVSGVSRGIKWLSNTNMVLAGLLALFVFVVGPTVFILNLLPTTIAGYVEQLAVLSSRTEAAGGEAVATWLSNWTIFYWAWWISWTPFVGMFIARISRGRTVRQFVTGVLVAPTLVSLVWFAVFGGLGIDLTLSGVDLGADGAPEAVLFTALAELPIPQITAVVVMVLVSIFFVSGADAASIVMGTLSHRGSLRPRRATVVMWGVTTGGVAAIMLLLGGEDALAGLQQITIIAALPFVVVMIGLAFALARDLSQDPVVVRRKYALAAVEHAVVAGVTEHGDDFQLTVEQSPPGEGVGEMVATLPVDAPAPDAPAAEPEPMGKDQAADASADVDEEGHDAGHDAGTASRPAP